MKIESYAPGSFCWAELATSDPAGAARFYSEMFGWTKVENPMPQGIYTLFQSGGNDAAGMYEAHAGMPSNWGPHFAVASVDAAAARAGELGGKVCAGPFDAHEAGRMAVLQDPDGAVFSVWQAKRNIGATHGGPMSMFCWPELHTPDPAGAAAFYTGLFGWSVKPDAGLDTAEYAELAIGGRPFGGLMPMRGPQWQGVPPHWMLYVTVAACDERVEKAKSLGAKVRVPPMDIPKVGRFAVIDDPQGAAFAIIQLNAM